MALITFSSSDYAEHERLEISRDIYAAMANIDVDLAKGQLPSIETRIRLLPGVSIALVKTSSLIVHRRNRQLQDGNDDFSLLINPAGRSHWITNLERAGELAGAPGQGCFTFNDRPGKIVFPESPTHMLNISFSRSLLGRLASDLESASTPSLLPQEPLRHLVQRALELTNDKAALASNSIDETHRLLDLTVLAVGARGDRAMHAHQRGLAHARLKAIKADLKVHAWRGDLSLSWVARRHGISPSYVRAMFERNGESFTDFLLEQRLERVFSRLSSPAHDGISIADIAYDAGFNNLSWFYRAFKRLYGLNPSDVRKHPARPY